MMPHMHGGAEPIPTGGPGLDDSPTDGDAGDRAHLIDGRSGETTRGLRSLSADAEAGETSLVDTPAESSREDG